MDKNNPLRAVALGMALLASGCAPAPTDDPATDGELKQLGTGANLAEQLTTRTGRDGFEVARLTAPAGDDGPPVQVVVLRRWGMVDELEVTAGEAPPPQSSIHDRANRVEPSRTASQRAAH
jgi:hypothetical protein